METPAPVNLSALQSILAKSKQVMKKVDSEKPIVSNGSNTKGLVESAYQESSSMYSEHDEKEMMFEQHAPTTNMHEALDYTEEQINNSKMPAIVKEAMRSKHIPKPKFTTSKFSIDDVSALIEKKPLAQPQQKRQLNENVNTSNDMITLSRAELQNMINEAVIGYFKKSYDKTITEETIRKTLNVLIKEGKLNTKTK